MALTISICVLCAMLAAYYFTALPRIMAPKLRKRQEQALDADDINAMIEMAPVQPAEDVDPDLTVNPVAVAMVQREKEKARQKEEQARKKRAEEKAKLAAKTRGAEGAVPSGETPPRRMGGAMNKLGISVAPAVPGPSKEEGGKDVGLKAIDLHVAKKAETAKKKEEARLAEQFPALGQ